MKQAADTAVIYEFISDFVNAIALLFGASLLLIAIVPLGFLILEISYGIKEDKSILPWSMRIGLFVSLCILFYILAKLAPEAYNYLYRNFSIEHVIKSPLLNSVLCLILGLLAYSLRCRARGAYGVWEIIIGIIVSYQGSYFRNTSMITFIGGLYIIVRGMDNIYKSISDDNELKQSWKDVFGEDT